jgi:glucose dehydrogenase
VARCGSRRSSTRSAVSRSFGTGNPNPWNSRGPGKNLWTDSIVALNLYTGQLVWGYQTAHHDLWDADLPNNGVMFDGKYKVPTKVTIKVKKRVRVHGKLVTRTVKKKVTRLVVQDASGRRIREQVRHDLHPRS